MEKGAVKLQYDCDRRTDSGCFHQAVGQVEVLSTSEPSLVWSLGRENDGVLLQGQFYSDGTRVVNCQYDRMSNHTKIHQEDVWL